MTGAATIDTARRRALLVERQLLDAVRVKWRYPTPLSKRLAD